MRWCLVFWLTNSWTLGTKSCLNVIENNHLEIACIGFCATWLQHSSSICTFSRRFKGCLHCLKSSMRGSSKGNDVSKKIVPGLACDFLLGEMSMNMASGNVTEKHHFERAYIGVLCANQLKVHSPCRKHSLALVLQGNASQRFWQKLRLLGCLHLVRCDSRIFTRR